MIDSLTLAEAASRYLQGIKGNSRAEIEGEIKRFMRWFGEDNIVSKIQGHDIFVYAESLGPINPEMSRRAEHVRRFLTFLKKEGLSQHNLASHLRLRRSANHGSAAGAAEDAIELTTEGLAELQRELESLKAQRPAIAEELRHAMMDKDFKENAPLDAARDKQAHVEARIRDLESRLKRAVLFERNDKAASKVLTGSTVSLTNLVNGAAVRYTIVNPSEASLAAGKISSASPVGKALMERREGEEIRVSAPAGEIRYRIEEIS